ncbi:MAG: sulfotransferase [Caldilineaceae bacterium]|nr:sulfotransferase [Caldilineaceae bacterium]
MFDLLFDLLGKQLTSGYFHNPIFVVGAGRSGTSVLQQALGKHPLILDVGGESPFIPYVGYLVYPFEFRENKQYHVDCLNTSTRYLYDQLRKLTFESVMGPHYGLRKSLASLRKLDTHRLTKRYWCAKTFPNQEECRGLLQLYPTAKFLYIFRNGYEVVHSRTRFGKMRERDFSSHCVEWSRHVEKFHYLFELKEAMHLRQEELASQPGALFPRIQQFLGIEYDEAPEKFAGSTLIHPLDQRTKTAVDVAQSFKERAPVYEGWSLEQRQTFKSICGSAMARLSYEIPF